jgi:hypothetical protein
MVERIAPAASGVDGDLERGPDLFLSNEIVQARRPQRGLGVSFVRQRVRRGNMEP